MRRLFLLSLGLMLLGCPRNAPPKTEAVRQPIRFTDIAQEAGIDFTHFNGGQGRKLMPETVGSGAAFFDYDNDGKLDLLILNSCSWPGDPSPKKTSPKLYKNLGNEKFADVTKEAGLERTFYGMGIAVGDWDNDGWEDLFLTAVGPNHLFHNEKGRFVDVTQAAGVVGVPLPGLTMENKWSSSAAFLDYDKDGKLDLFVLQYVKWSPTLDPFCGKNGRRGYCPPGTFEGARNTLYHNEGSGKFKDVTEATGLMEVAIGKSFGIGLVDYNDDGWLDIAVANDTWANFLLLNEGGKKFVDKGVESGVAFAESGKAKAGMGIDVADIRNDGRFCFIIGNFAEEGLSLFAPMEGAPGMFENQAQALGLVSPSLLNVTFGTFFFDYDLDGWQDALAANGHVDDIVSTYNSNLTFKQTPLLFHNEQGKRFADVSKAAGLDFPVVGRGAACGDIDDDGDLDVALVDNNGRFKLLRNDGGNQNRWIRLKLIGTTSNRDAIGARVILKAGGITQQQYVKSAGSFLSESQRALTFGLGATEKIDSIEIIWPSGQRESLAGQPCGKLYLIKEGQGILPS